MAIHVGIRGPGHLSRTGASSSAAAVTYTAPFYDGFDAPLGSIFASVTPFRAPQGGTWLVSQISGTNTTAFSVQSNGTVTNNTGSSPSNVFATLSVASTANRWNGFRSLDATLAGQYGTDMTIAGSSYTYLQFATLSSGGLKVLRYTPIVATVSGSASNLNNSNHVAGDSYVLYEYPSVSDTLIDCYQNGRLIRGSSAGVESTPYNVTATGGVTLGPIGYRGNPTTSSVTLDEQFVGDPTVHGMVMLVDPSRVIQRESNGDCVSHFDFAFSMGTPTSMTYTAYDFVAGTALPGHSAASVASYVAGTLSASGQSAAITSPPSTGYFIRTFRPDVVISGSPAVAAASGSIHYPGEVILLTGQSIMTKAWNATTGGTLTATNCWRIDASYGENTSAPLSFPTAASRRQRPLAATTPLMDAAATLQANGINVPIAFINGGAGGTFISQRVPGGSIPAGGTETLFQAETDGVRHAGRNFLWAYNVAGQFDTGSSDRANYVTNFNLIFSAHQVTVGHAIKVIEEPLTAIWGGVDADVEALRRLQSLQPVNNATIQCFLGPYMMDQAQTDVYHFSSGTNFAEELRRGMWTRLKAEGLSVYDRTGPYLDTTTSPTYNAGAQTVTVTFNLGPFTSLNLLNDGGGALTSGAGALGGDHRGGIRFWKTAVGGTEGLPTAASVGVPSGGKCTVTWTFAGGTFSSAPKVGGPWGATPFNSFNNTTLRGTTQWNKVDGTGVNILQGVLAGEPNVAVAPYYNAAGATDGSQDYLQSV